MISVGDIFDGKVVSVMPFGAFVEFDKNQSGLVHISEISTSYVQDINEHIKKGDEVIADGKEDLSYRVIMAQGSRPVDNDVPNELKLQGVPPEDIKGFWGNVTFSDGSGNAFCVEDVKHNFL